MFGAGKVYSASGYDMILSVVHPAEEAAGHAQFAAQGRVNGVVVHAPLVEDGRVSPCSAASAYPSRC